MTSTCGWASTSLFCLAMHLMHRSFPCPLPFPFQPVLSAGSAASATAGVFGFGSLFTLSWGSAFGCAIVVVLQQAAATVLTLMVHLRCAAAEPNAFSTFTCVGWGG